MARVSQTRRRHCRHRSFARLARRAGYTGTNDSVTGYQANVIPSRALQFHVDQDARLTPASDGVAELGAAMCLEQGDATSYTHEQVIAASAPGDIGLT